MPIKNKKGMVLEYFLIISLFLGIGFWAAGYLGEHKAMKNYIGQYQFSIMNSKNKAQSVLFYIEQSAKYSLQKSVYDLAKDGGFSNEISDEGISVETNECGRFDGANIWYELKKGKEGKIIRESCFDEKLLIDSLKNKFDENLNEYLSNYPYEIPIRNYDYKVSDSLEITGTAREPLVFDILKDEGKPAVKMPKEVKIQIEPKNPEEKKPPEEKPAEPKETKPSVQTRDFQDFTGTDLCAKGTKCLLTKEAYSLLLKSQDIAKQKKLDLEVTSAYRSMDRQIEIWEANKEKYHNNPDLEGKFIANPYKCRGVCPHGTGDVVDIHFKGKPFKMDAKDSELLEWVMAQAGWVRYKKETWHFECCGTDRYNRAQEIARQTGKPVIAIT